MRIPSGKTDQKIYFVAVDATDFHTRETGLATWAVSRSRNGGTRVAYTTPTIAEIDATNMPGVYALTIDEDTTIDGSSDSEEYCVHITHAGMDPVTRTFELYRDPAAIILDRADGVESGLTVRGYLRLATSVLLSKVSGLGTTNPLFRDYNDTKVRVNATVDSDGNRTAITRDLT